MPFPTATTPDSRLSLDDLIAQNNVDKEEFETQPETRRDPVPMPGVPKVLTAEEQAKVSAETAAAAGEQIAGLVDNGARALCGMIGQEKDDKYRISSGQRHDLADSYGRVAEHYGFSGANPVFEAILLTFIIFTPKFRDAFQDRKIKRIEAEQQRQADEIRRQQLEINRLKAQSEINELKHNQDGGSSKE